MVGIAGIGMRLLAVVGVDRGPVRWMVSMREAKRREKNRYTQVQRRNGPDAPFAFVRNSGY